MATVVSVEADGGAAGDGTPARLPVFVYGTLRPGRVNWPVAEPWCERTAPATLPGFGLYALDYPCAVEVEVGAPEGAGGVRGDLLVLDAGRWAAALDHLDRFEGFDPDDPDRSYYRRVERAVRLEDGSVLRAWVYVPGADLLTRVDPSRRVPGDDWPAR